jgi:hypothetical protein
MRRMPVLAGEVTLDGRRQASRVQVDVGVEVA